MSGLSQRNVQGMGVDSELGSAGAWGQNQSLMDSALTCSFAKPVFSSSGGDSGGQSKHHCYVGRQVPNAHLKAT